MSEIVKKAPSNKKDGSTYLAKLSKEQLIERYQDAQAKILRYEEEMEKMGKEMLEMQKTISNMKKGYDIINTEDSVVKRVLELRAKSYAPAIISEKLKYLGISVSTDKVNNIINAELSPELDAYYSKCREEYIESIKINTKYFKQSSIDELQRLIDSCYADLEVEGVEDVKIRMGLRNELLNLIAKRDNLMKDIDEVSVNSEEEELMNETVEDFKTLTDNIIDFTKIGKIRHIGGA